MDMCAICGRPVRDCGDVVYVKGVGQICDSCIEPETESGAILTVSELDLSEG